LSATGIQIAVGTPAFELRHPKEGHKFSHSIYPRFPPSAPILVGGPHLSFCFLGSARSRRECKAFRTGGVTPGC